MPNQYQKKEEEVGRIPPSRQFSRVMLRWLDTYAKHHNHTQWSHHRDSMSSAQSQKKIRRTSPSPVPASTLAPDTSIRKVETRISILAGQLYCLTPQVLVAANKLHLLK